jgi:hypothetical protein|eukprot:COSAG06_NODE_1765_length_8440_cov_40.732406_10_plen_129_part_00
MTCALTLAGPWQVRTEMSVAIPRHRRLEALESALGQLHDTTQTMLGEITTLQRELSAVNADEGAGTRQQQPLVAVTTAQQARLDGRASLSPSFRPTAGHSALGVTAQWFHAEADRFGTADDGFPGEHD